MLAQPLRQPDLPAPTPTPGRPPLRLVPPPTPPIIQPVEDPAPWNLAATPPRYWRPRLALEPHGRVSPCGIAVKQRHYRWEMDVPPRVCRAMHATYWTAMTAAAVWTLAGVAVH